MIRYGTSHFVNRDFALAYYRSYGATAASVDRKIASGEIYIGEPELKPGERLVVIDKGSRYAIESE